MENNSYLVKIMLVASKKALTSKWERVSRTTDKGPVSNNHQRNYNRTTEKLTHKLRLQEARWDKKWRKWTIYKAQTGNM